MNIKLKKYYITLIMFILTIVSYSQENPPADDDPVPVPINNHIVWLLILGIVFVIFYFKNRNVTAK